MHVHPNYQRRGLASELLAELRTRVRSAGYESLALEPTAKHESAAAFSQCRGFENGSDGR